MRAVYLVLVLAACSKSESAAPAPKAAPPAEHHEMAGMPPALDKFHGILAPRWHAQQGEQRMKDTCGAIGEFQSGADAVAKSKSDPKWDAAAKDLVAAVTGLDTACKANDAAAFEPAFKKVHEGFHAMLEAGGGEHEEHK